MTRTRPALEILEERLTPSGFQTLYNFTGGNDGSIVQAGVAVDSSGDLYGATKFGGANSFGTMYEISANGTFTTLYNLSGGSTGTPLLDGHGNLFDTTESGGTDNQGTVFEMSTDGKTYTTLHSFTGTDGSDPEDGLVMDGKRDLFGTTWGGGGSNSYSGTVFELSPNGSGGYNFQTLHAFSGNDGINLISGLLLDNKGNLYGMAAQGGADDFGTVYELSPNGSGGYNFTVLHTFTGGSDGRQPVGGLIMDGSGNLYGTTEIGNTVFELNPTSQAFTTLYSFDGGHGDLPQGTLLRDARGNLYGTTTEGTASNAGTVFELSPNGSGGYTITNLYNFSGTNDGSEPFAGVTAYNGNLYGTTLGGGPDDKGTVFEITGALNTSSTTTTASNATAVFSTNTQNVTLTADVTSSAGTVDEGTVTFTVLKGSIVVGSATTSATVSNGAASVSYALPPGTAIGTYTIDAEYNPGPDFTTSSDTTHTLTVSGASTTTAANNATVTYSGSAQDVTLTADVTSSAGAVNEGTVTFTVKQGATVIGTATTSGTVNNGAASVSYALPAGTAADTYTIDAVYNPGPDFTTSTDDSHTLTVSTASTTTAATSATAVFSTNTQNVTLTANVTSGAGAVNEGTVTFTILQGGAVIGSATTSTTVSNGAASVSYSLPGGTAAGNYTIDAMYNPGSNFVTSSDDTRTLTVTPANVTTTAVNASAIYSASSQTVTLNATVADTSVPGDTVGEGTVTFMVKSGQTQIGTSVQGTVKGGKASADFNLPAGQAAGSYTITVSYGDNPDNFTDNKDTNATLTVLLAPTVTTNPTNVTVTAGQTATFTAAAIGNPAPTVKWQVSSDGGSTWTDISGATTTTLTLSNVSSSLDDNEYRAVFTNSLGSVATNAATLTVQTVPVVMTNPASQTVTAGQTVTFTAAASGNPTPTVQWQFSTDGGKTWTNVRGATSTTLTFGNVLSALNGDEYRAVFNNSAGSAMTNAALLIVQTPPSITSVNSAGFTVGQVGSFTVTVAGSPTPMLTESGALPGGITFADNGNGTATLGGAPAAGTQGTYHFTLTAHNGVGGDATQSFTLTVNPAPVPSSPPPSPPAPVSGHQPPILNVPPLLALFDSLLKGIETVNTNNTETVTDSLFGMTVLVSTYDGSGNFMSATLFGVPMPNWIWFL